MSYSEWDKTLEKYYSVLLLKSLNFTNVHFKALLFISCDVTQLIAKTYC